MVIRNIERNKYGGYTWKIKLDSVFFIEINSTPEKTFIVDFKELKLIKNKIHFSFVSKRDLKSVIQESFDKIFDYFKYNKDFQWGEGEKKNKLEKIYEYLVRGNDQITISHLAEDTVKKVTPIQIIRGISIDNNLIDLNTYNDVIDKYGQPVDEKIHNNYSVELKYSKHGMSFFYKLNDPLRIIFFIIATGEVVCITENGLIFNENLSLESVFVAYGVGEAKATASSSEAYVQYSGILFYFLKENLKQSQLEKIKITKIGVMNKNI